MDDGSNGRRADAIEERIEEAGDDAGFRERQEVVGVQLSQIAVRHDAAVLSRRLDRDEHVVAPVHDQGRPVPVRECAAHPAGIGIEEVAGVGHVEVRVVPCTEVRQPVLGDPQQGELRAVHEVIETVLPEQLQLLDAGGRQQRQRGDRRRLPLQQLDRHDPAHAESDHVGAFDPQLPEHVGDVVGSCCRGVVRQVAVAGPEPGQVGNEDPPPVRQPLGQCTQVPLRAGAAVQQHDRFRSCGALGSEVEEHHPDVAIARPLPVDPGQAHRDLTRLGAAGAATRARHVGRQQQHPVERRQDELASRSPGHDHPSRNGGEA